MRGYLDTLETIADAYQACIRDTAGLAGVTLHLTEKIGRANKAQLRHASEAAKRLFAARGGKIQRPGMVADSDTHCGHPNKHGHLVAHVYNVKEENFNIAGETLREAAQVNTCRRCARPRSQATHYDERSRATVVSGTPAKRGECSCVGDFTCAACDTEPAPLRSSTGCRYCHGSGCIACDTFAD